MGKGYPVTMRKRLVEAYHKELGSIDELSQIFNVHPGTVRRWLKKFEAEGHLEPKPHGGGQPRKLEHEDALFLDQLLEQDCDLTQMEMLERLESERGKSISPTTLRRELDRLDITRKKNTTGRSKG